MVVNSDGSAAGGNDIDEAFYLYMLRDLTRDLKTDAGEAYDSLSDFDLREAILTPYFANIDNRILMEDAWLRIKNSRDIHSLPSVPFSFEASLRRWLLDNGHKDRCRPSRRVSYGRLPIHHRRLHQKGIQPHFRQHRGES